MDFSNMRVLVIGDICLDIIEDGISNRLSPEAPVPVILNPTTQYFLGMAGNTAMNLKSLGADVYLSTVFSNDRGGLKISKILIEEGIKQFGILKCSNNSPTILKKRIMANGKQVARVDKEYKIEISDEDMSYYMDTLNNIKFDLIIISDYNKGVITHSTWKELQKVVWENNKGRIFVDTKKHNIASFYEGCILTPNTLEAENIISYYNVNSLSDMLIELDTDMIIQTASEKGSYLFKKDGVINSPTISQNFIDVYGAGDTFISAFALYFTKFGNAKRAMDFANYCCSKVIQKKGTTPINIKEVIDFK